MLDAICLRAVEFRATSDTGDGRTLEGYAAVFDTPARIQSWEGEFDEEIVRGAFRKTIRARTPVLQFDHGRDMRTGSVPIGAIDELNEDEQGLFVRAPLFDNAVVEPIRQAIAGSAISGSARPAGNASCRQHQALLFPDDQSHLLANRTGAAVGQLSEC